MRYVAVASSAITGLFVAAVMALAAPPGVIQSFDALCDAAFPTRCATVNADGSVSVKPPAGTAGVTGVKATAADPAYVEGSDGNPMSSDLAGYLRVLAKQGSTPWIVSGAVTQGGAPWSVTGSGAAGTPATGVVTAQGIAGGTPMPVVGAISVADGSTGTASLKTFSLSGIFNGATFDAQRGAVNGLNLLVPAVAGAQIVGQCDDTAPTALTENNFGNARINCTTHAQLVEAIPSASAVAGVPIVAQTALQAGLAIKASPGNLYGAQVSTTSVAGYLMIFNLTTQPADGVVTPLATCYAPAFGTCGLNFDPPAFMSVGVSISFSSANSPYTKLGSPTAFIAAQVQ